VDRVAVQRGQARVDRQQLAPETRARLDQTVAPTLCGRSDAPMTTTLLGANMESRWRMLIVQAVFGS